MRGASGCDAHSNKTNFRAGVPLAQGSTIAAVKQAVVVEMHLMVSLSRALHSHLLVKHPQCCLQHVQLLAHCPLNAGILLYIASKQALIPYPTHPTHLLVQHPQCCLHHVQLLTHGRDL